MVKDPGQERAGMPRSRQRPRGGTACGAAGLW